MYMFLKQENHEINDFERKKKFGYNGKLSIRWKDVKKRFAILFRCYLPILMWELGGGG